MKADRFQAEALALLYSCCAGWSLNFTGSWSIASLTAMSSKELVIYTDFFYFILQFSSNTVSSDQKGTKSNLLNIPEKTKRFILLDSFSEPCKTHIFSSFSPRCSSQLVIITTTDEQK